MSKFERKSIKIYIGDVEIETSPNIDQRKNITNYITEFNVQLIKKSADKINKVIKKTKQITKKRIRKIESESLNESVEENIVLTKKLLLLLTNIKEEDLTDKSLKDPNDELEMIIYEINKIIEPYVLRYQEIYTKNLKEEIKNMEAGA